MLQKDFLSNVEQDEVLELKEEQEGAFIVYNSKVKSKYKIDKSSVEENDWNNLKEVLNGREPFIMDGITRIVGYFSKVSNWNQSKLGELNDRRSGDYCIK